MCVHFLLTKMIIQKMSHTAKCISTHLFKKFCPMWFFLCVDKRTILCWEKSSAVISALDFNVQSFNTNVIHANIFMPPDG